MEPYIVVLAAFGVLILLTAWLPMVLKEAPLSLPMLCIGIGAALFALPGVPAGAPHPASHLKVVERLTELVVIISLMGAGLKLDRELAWRPHALIAELHQADETRGHRFRPEAPHVAWSQ
jgi:sodium/hydrogen antiporter